MHIIEECVWGASLERSVGCTVVVWVREKLRHE